LRPLLPLLLIAGLAACQAPDPSPGQIDWVAPEDRAVWLGAPVAPDGLRFVRFGDIWQREDYGFYDKEGVTAEVVFLSADRRNTVALDFRMVTRDSVETFAALAAVTARWDPAQPVPGWRRQLFYRTFTRTAPDRACVGFAGAWDLVVEDPEQRPRNALFGYVCNPPGKPMSPSDAAAIVQGIRVEPAAAWRGRGAADRPDNPEALSFARGTVERGNGDFPFRLARFYVVGNGRNGFQ